jgi:hypothetical protein
MSSISRLHYLGWKGEKLLFMRGELGSGYVIMEEYLGTEFNLRDHEDSFEDIPVTSLNWYTCKI